jgi:hypothetical protein
MQRLGYVFIIVIGRANNNNRYGFELICRAMADIRQFQPGKLTPHSFAFLRGKKLKQKTIIGM